MAKLNVEVLDMRNGEITKVTYEGAKYALLGTDVTVKAGDLVQSNVSLCDVEVGDFFKTFERDGDIEFKDNDNDYRDANYGEERYNIFRKISAQSKPTIEQRVGALESDVAAMKGEKVVEEPKRLTTGDIAKVISRSSGMNGKVGDVVKIVKDDKSNWPYECVRVIDQVPLGWLYEHELEAYNEETIEFEGATYRKVDREAREGDVVIFKDGIFNVRWITKGKPYKAFKDEGAAYVTGDDGDDINVYESDYRNRTHETVDVYEPTEQAKYVPQEGDIVVIVKSEHGSRNSVGDIGKVSDVSTVNFAVDVPQKPKAPRTNGNKHVAYEVRKATPAEVEKYEQALMEIEKAHKDTEIAEKWAKIGRKHNEFKKGDVVFVTHPDGGKVYGIIHEDSCGHKIKVDFGKRYSICTEEKSELTLVAPVNSRFNA